MRILLTNDDGIDSIALGPTIKELEKIDGVEFDIVIPQYEQSWTSKSNTRRGEDIDIFRIEKFGHEIVAVDGLPADCANFGIYNGEKKPDLIVSGANVGHNIGLSALYSSGTIGAALEGLIAGIPSIAISVPYNDMLELSEERFYEVLDGITDIITKFYSQRFDDFWLMNLNIPIDIEELEFIATSLSKNSYGPLFDIDRDGLMQPNSYYNLSYPQQEEVEENTDLWARYNQKSSVIILNEFGNIIDPDIVDDWLSSVDLI